jgi:hypothetical protein
MSINCFHKQKTNLNNLLASASVSVSASVSNRITNEEKKSLDKSARILKKLYQQSGFDFDVNKFKKIIINLYHSTPSRSPRSSTRRIGGAGELTTTRKATHASIKNDFFAILGLFISIFLLFLAFYKVKSLSCLNGVSVLSEDIKRSISELSSSDLSFLSFLKQLFQDVANKESARILSFIKESLMDVSKNIISKSTEVCMTDTVSFDTGYNNVNNVLNILSNGVTTWVNSNTKSSECILRTSNLLTQQFINNKLLDMQLLTTKLTTEVEFIKYCINISLTMGSVSLFYLTNRIWTRNSNKFIQSERVEQLTGGGRKRSFRKSRSKR